MAYLYCTTDKRGCSPIGGCEELAVMYFAAFFVCTVDTQGNKKREKHKKYRLLCKKKCFSHPKERIIRDHLAIVQDWKI